MEDLDGNCMAKNEVDEKEVSNGNNNIITPAQEAYMSVPKDDLYYKMNHRKRGLAYIFNHQHFKECTERHGTREDTNLLARTLEKFKFEVNIFTDLDKKDVMDHINRAAAFDHSDYDCFLVAVLTHGDDNLLWAKDKTYFPHDIFNKFTGDMCPSLAGKPKIFIIQACQGKEVDPGITLIERTETDGPRSTRGYKIPVRADFLIVYASFKGYYAFRNNSTGSYFISSLCEKLSERGTVDHILVILTLVNQSVAVNYTCRSRSPEFNGKKQMPYFHCSLTRLLQFTS